MQFPIYFPVPLGYEPGFQVTLEVDEKGQTAEAIATGAETSNRSTSSPTLGIVCTAEVVET